MAAPPRPPQAPHCAYAGLDFIKAAFCPLDFKAMPFRQHPDWQHLGADEGLAPLEVGTALRYPRQFPYTDPNGHTGEKGEEGPWLHHPTNPPRRRRMLTDWQQWFPDCEPVAHFLPARFSDRWVRFHSLPGSKRYPEDETEYATVLERHNRILGELGRPGQTVILLSTGYSESPEPVRPQPEWWALDAGAEPWRTVAMHQADAAFADPSYWHVFASERQWEPGALDGIIRLVADDILVNVMVVAPDCRWLVHPYDGGMDVIAESQAARDRLKAAFSGWLSARPDGR